ncbi:e3 ubiquitin-protein ligase [Anaeramoeba flamelloides]|uniref:E3 ubiquitin-protein ligase n=1 Tax=Anaeramoeba flamelloides TaxID=1746091 RepID=A0ABQ8XUP1_9EUKA|nr:e3 ubiquitin-protein ligase [Anaeramoeba flamelloides]
MPTKKLKNNEKKTKKNNYIQVGRDFLEKPWKTIGIRDFPFKWEVLKAIDRLIDELKELTDQNRTKNGKTIIYTKKTLSEDILKIVPDIDLEYLDNLIKKNIEFEKQITMIDNPLHIIMDIIIQKPYPRVLIREEKIIRERDMLKVNWMNNTEPVSEKYKKQVLQIFLNEFLKLKPKSIDRVLKQNGYRYTPSYPILEKCVPTKKELLEGDNKIKPIEGILDERLGYEIKAHQIKYKEEMEKNDLELAKKIFNDVNQIKDEKMNCGCCYTTHSFENMVSCKAGHLFCKNCLHSLVKTEIGKGSGVIKCPSFEKCNGGFSIEMINKAVPEKTWSLFERLVQQSEINKAGIENLKKCPHCNYAVIIDNKEETCIFECLNPECMRDTCLICMEEAHPGLTCEENNKEITNDEEVMRKYIEEEMTKALIRTCNNCQQNYFKSQGCNKVICTNCGEIMCYLCQLSINKEKYSHFSDKRGGCKLFTNERDDLKRVEAAEKIAKAKVEKLLKKKNLERSKIMKYRMQNYIKKH